MTQTLHILLLILGVNMNSGHSPPGSLYVFDIFYFPVELLEYAVRLGIDVNTEKHLLHIAREGLLAELPAGWRPW